MFGRLSTRSRIANYALTAGLIAFAFSMGASSTAEAQSCQASIALSPFIIPANLNTGDDVTIDVTVLNTSTTNPGGTPVAANLGGTTFVKMACADAGCATELPGTLDFVGCDFNVGQVATCQPELSDPTGNTIRIDFTPGGVALAPSASASVAMIRAVAVLPVTSNPDGTFFARGQTNDGDLMTDDAACNPQVTGEAGGSVTATFPPGFPFVEITKLCTGCRANEGNTALATITVTNSGEAGATNCTVTDIFDNGAPVVVGNIPSLPAGGVEVFEYTTPSFSSATPNSAEVTCEAPICPLDEPDCQTEDVFDTNCPCGNFVPPCSGVECEICFPDDLKQEKINTF